MVSVQKPLVTEEPRSRNVAQVAVRQLANQTTVPNAWIRVALRGIDPTNTHTWSADLSVGWKSDARTTLRSALLASGQRLGHHRFNLGHAKFNLGTWGKNRPVPLLGNGT